MVQKLANEPMTVREFAQELGNIISRAGELFPNIRAVAQLGTLEDLGSLITSNLLGLCNNLDTKLNAVQQKTILNTLSEACIVRSNHSVPINTALLTIATYINSLAPSGDIR